MMINAKSQYGKYKDHLVGQLTSISLKHYLVLTYMIIPEKYTLQDPGNSKYTTTNRPRGSLSQ